MAASTRLTVLVENTSARPDLVAEHGWAVHVESDGVCGLLDTGASDAVVHNARALAIDLSQLAWIALSHGHYDHTGGLDAVLVAAPQATVFAHPDALTPKWARAESGEMRSIGLPRPLPPSCTVRTVVGWTQIAPGVCMTGPIPRSVAFEPANDHFRAREGEKDVVDPFLDDQALVLSTAAGSVLLLGCAHAGVMNTILHVMEETEAPVKAVIGGMHLDSAAEARLRKTVKALHELGIADVRPSHCSGERMQALFSDAFEDTDAGCPAGTVLAF